MVNTLVALINCYVAVSYLQVKIRFNNIRISKFKFGTLKKLDQVYIWHGNVV